VYLLQELKSQFQKDGLLLSIATAVTGVAAKDSYDIPRIHPHIDFLNFMSYDLHGPWSEITGINGEFRSRLLWDFL
jgi:chitinase